MIEHGISYCQKRLAEAGITPELNRVKYVYQRVVHEGYIFEKDEADNIQIRFLDPEGNQVTYFNGKSTKPVIRTRRKIPKENQKYHTQVGCETYPFIWHSLIEAFRLGLIIETLFITEGEFKAAVSCINALPCIGIAGIHQSLPAKSQSLHPFILQIVEVCQVKNLVLLFDNDALQMTGNDQELTPERMMDRDLRKRSNLFVAAVKNFKEAGKSLNVDLYFGYIKPENKAKGLDDLFTALPTESRDIVADALLLSKASRYFHILSLKDNSYNRLNTVFGVDSVETFYSLHAELLQENDFKFGNIIYRFDPITKSVIESPNNFCRFWISKVDEITHAISVSLDLENLLQLLHTQGFRLYQLDISEYILVGIKDNIVNQISQKDVKDFVRDYIHFQKAITDQVKHAVLNATNAYTGLFSMEKLNALKCIGNDFHTDTYTAMFFYYQNGFVEVNKENITLKPYSELKGFIWKSQILPREYKQPVDPRDVEDFMYFKFIERVCSRREGETWLADLKRLNSLTSLIGYALHTAKKERRAIVLTDTDISNNPEGRTGKTIFAGAIGKLRILAEIDGKSFDPTDRFRYQDASLDTQILHINDAGRGKKPFDFELMFTAVTEGVRVEKKREHTFTIRPTIIISSNRALQISGGSARARIIEFEFANYFSDRHTPKDEFGCWFFEDWSEKQWNLFDCFMLTCSQNYLATGIVFPEQVKLEERKLVQSTGNNTDFQKFAEDNLKTGVTYIKKALLESFKVEFPEYELMSSKTFTKWLVAFGAFKNWIITEGSKDKNGNRTLIYKTIDK